MSPGTTSPLFQPMVVGDMNLAHRVVLAPMTRYRNDDAHAPTEMGIEYYKQRASVPGTLLITEATFISGQASGQPNAPGIWNDTQVAAWKKVGAAQTLVLYVTTLTECSCRLSIRFMHRVRTFTSSSGPSVALPVRLSSTRSSRTTPLLHHHLLHSSHTLNPFRAN